MHANARRESGFSLTELMIAMVVTLIVGGAIVGLLGTGNTSFQKDPERTDRQQNIRISMDLIQRDIQSAGMKMEAFDQAFRNLLNGTSTVASVINTAEQADALALWGNDGSCPDITVNSANPTDGANINLESPSPGCYENDEYVMVHYGNGQSLWGFAHNIHAQNRKINFPPGLNIPPESEINSIAALTASGQPITISKINYIRYEVAVDPGDTVPSLFRSDRGGVGTDGVYHPAPDPTARWQLVARGVEDLQVQYRTANGWTDNAGTVVQDQFNTIVQEVRVALSSRTISDNVLGPGLPQRGQLSTVMSPRAALFALQTSTDPALQWR